MTRDEACGSQVNALDQPLDGLVERGIFPHQRLDLIDGMEHGRVVLATEGQADLGEGGVGEVARQIHGDLTEKATALVRFLALRSESVNTRRDGRSVDSGI